jgi:hypothetical protein
MDLFVFLAVLAAGHVGRAEQEDILAALDEAIASRESVIRTAAQLAQAAAGIARGLAQLNREGS